MPLLEIKNLHVEIDGKEILNGLDLAVNAGEVHAIMGPNGSGKSTLAYVLAGKAGYEVDRGEVLFNGEDLLDLEPDERAARAVPGLPVSDRDSRRRDHDVPAHGAERAAQEARRGGAVDAGFPQARARGGREAQDRSGNAEAARVNVGFSGGEKKRNEILQMALLEPRLAVLDETDSGLDIDALRIVADGVNALRSPDRAVRRHHALPAAARLHRARRGACAVEGPHRADRRQGAGARARSKGYAEYQAERGGVSAMSATPIDR